jgi:hypothetical protein
MDEGKAARAAAFGVRAECPTRRPVLVLAGFLALAGAALGQTPSAGSDQAAVFPYPATLAASIQGATPLTYWTGDGNGATENFVLKYDDRFGVSAIGPLRTSAGGSFGYPTDLVRIGTTIYGIDGLRRMLYTLDPATGIVSPIGTAWPSTYADVESLAYDAGRNRLYAVDRTTGQLLILSRTGGTVTLVGNRTLSAYANIRSLAYRPANGLLYAVDQTTRGLLSIDPNTGVPTYLSTMAAEAHGRIEELEFFNDKLYGIDAIDDGTSLVSAQLQRIYTNVGLVQNIGPVLNQVSALCLIVDSIPEDHVWSKVSGPGVVTFSDVYALNPTVRFSKPGTYVLQLTVYTTSGPRSDTMTVVQQDWTPWTPSADSRIVYVSSATGNDGFNGLSPATPKRTIAGGRSMLRNGYPDWLLLERGGAWDEPLGTWGLSGRSAGERMLVSSYGSSPERPLLRTGTQSGFSAFAGTPTDDMAIVGLHFWCNGYTGSQGQPRGLQLFGQIQNFLIEDCCVEGYETNVVVQGANEYPSPTGRHKNIALRRNVVIDAYNTGGTNSEGIFASGTDTLVLSENVFDRNGWRDDIAGSEPTWYRHNIYIQNLNTDVVVVGNIVSRTDGLHSRSGGIVDDNLILRNALGLMYGGGGFPAIEADGVFGTVRRNVILDGGDLQPGSPRGWGLWMANVRQATVDRNVVALNSHGHAPFPVSFDVANTGRGVENTVFSNNLVYAWNGISRFTGNASQTVNVKFLNNCFQNPFTYDPLVVHDQASSTLGITSANNVFGSIAAPWAWMQSGGGLLSLAQWKTLVRDTTSSGQWTQFPDPGRSIPTYQVSIGRTGTLAAFILEARKQSRAFWRPEYTADAVNTYIRAGYGM